MIQISTQNLQSFLLESQEEVNCSLQKEEGDFYNSIKVELNNELREPHPSTIEKILAYSRNQN